MKTPQPAPFPCHGTSAAFLTFQEKHRQFLRNPAMLCAHGYRNGYNFGDLLRFTVECDLFLHKIPERRDPLRMA